MKSIKDLKLKDNEIKAVEELKKTILGIYPDAEIILFGSKARGDYTEDSDIDILILLNTEVNSKLEEKIIGDIYDIELKYGLLFGPLIKNINDWNNDYKGNPFLKENILREGMFI
ncbi:MAG: nucleotidyltransferase domain-containing protein [Candidatus Acidulodesulfobacterium acidiphilum]|uniref:Nucleotidyltransferase domain-containing protein n=1 Tax=Candidatus Acidulodesulfobacterium acidiphilum TaxID=2597224 RepID=A0A520X715_9DELT|nr:MAG: nucleotidyltransferase domain-containing protein [Candidatus Acidulodesulfobacterium acidiphilum]